MVVDHRAGYLEDMRRLTGVLVEPVYRIAALPADVARATRTAVVSQDTLAKENRELRDALLLAQARLNRLDALVAQNARLKDLLDAQNSLGLSVQLARLVGGDDDPGSDARDSGHGRALGPAHDRIRHRRDRSAGIAEHSDQRRRAGR